MVVYDEFYRANAAFINARQAQMAANQPVIEGEQRTDIRTVDPALVERMVALVQKVAVSDLSGTLQDAHFILKALEPVDDDLVQARRVARDVLDGPEQSVAFLNNITDGHNDRWPEVRIALAAIKRGRELERERGEAGR